MMFSGDPSVGTASIGCTLLRLAAGVRVARAGGVYGVSERDRGVN
jgi:hypothetical protein